MMTTITVHEFPGSDYSTCTSTHTINGKILDRIKFPFIVVCLGTGRIYSRHKTVNAALNVTDKIRHAATAYIGQDVIDPWKYELWGKVIKLTIK